MHYKQSCFAPGPSLLYGFYHFSSSTHYNKPSKNVDTEISVYLTECNQVFVRNYLKHLIFLIISPKVSAYFSGDSMMSKSFAAAFGRNFLGQSPTWYKQTILFFLIINPPLVLLSLGPAVAGWLLVIEFIFTLAMALKCYPLQPGGLLVVEAIVMGPRDARCPLC